MFGLDLQVSEVLTFGGTKPALAPLLQPLDAHSSRLRLTVGVGSVWKAEAEGFLWRVYRCLFLLLCILGGVEGLSCDVTCI